MPKKLITYVLTISQVFPAYHPRKGEPTNFPLAIKHYDKIHTIRANYNLWKKRFEKIDRGEACLSVRIWLGRPYFSKQPEIFNYTKSNGIGLEKIELTALGYFINNIESDVTTAELAKNDGLSLEDFKAWFKGKIKVDEPMAIIHFTNFRYQPQCSPD